MGLIWSKLEPIEKTGDFDISFAYHISIYNYNILLLLKVFFCKKKLYNSKLDFLKTKLFLNTSHFWFLQFWSFIRVYFRVSQTFFKLLPFKKLK